MKRVIWFTFPLFFVLLFAAPDRSVAANGQEIFLPMIRQRMPELEAIDGPLLVDGEHRRVYPRAEVDGVQRTVALDTGSGELLQVFVPAGLPSIGPGNNCWSTREMTA